MARSEYVILDSGVVEGRGLLDKRSREDLEEYMNDLGAEGWEISALDCNELAGPQELRPGDQATAAPAHLFRSARSRAEPQRRKRAAADRRLPPSGAPQGSLVRVAGVRRTGGDRHCATVPVAARDILGLFLLQESGYALGTTSPSEVERKSTTSESA